MRADDDDDSKLGALDPQIARLPHPQRFIAAMTKLLAAGGRTLGDAPFYELSLGKDVYRAVVEELARNPMDWVAITKLAREHPAFYQFSEAMSHGRGATFAGNSYWALDFIRWSEQGRHFMQTTDALEAGLLATDVGEDTPISYVRSPYPIMYLQFGETMSSPLKVWNDSTQFHTAEGAYILTGTVPEGVGVIPESPPAGGQRFLQFVFTGSPLSKAHDLDDATQAMTLAIPDETETTLQVIERALQLDENLGRHKNPNDAACLRAVFFHACKVLLYLNTDAVVQSPRKERTELMAQMARMKGGKVAKLARKLPRAYDRIVIGPRITTAPDPAASAHGDSGRHLAAHWRRGHFRDQRVGPGRLSTRLKWIEPILVNAAAALAALPDSKPYVVKD